MRVGGPLGGARVTPEQMALVVASAAPGAHVVFVIVEVPGAPPPPAADVPKSWTAPPEAAGQAPAIAQRQEPFTTDELATVLRVARDTVSHWCRTGVLKGATKPAGGSWRIPPSAVLALLSASAGPPASANGRPDESPAHEPSAGPPPAGADVRAGDDSEAFDIASLGGWRRRTGVNGYGPNGYGRNAGSGDTGSTP